MKTFTFPKETMESINTLVLTSPTPTLEDARMCIKIADNLEAELEKAKEEDKEFEITVELADEKFMFMKKKLEDHGMSGKAGIVWVDKRKYVNMMNELDEIAK